MKYFLFILKSAFFDLFRNKGRSFLTSLGILIGVLAVVLLIALGLGLKKYIDEQFKSLGANLIFAMPGSKKTIIRGGGLMSGVRFDEKDVVKIKRIKTVSSVAPVFANPGIEIEANGRAEVVELIGSTEEIIPIFNLEIEEGRLIEKKDIAKRSKVVNISRKIAEKLFDSEKEAVGKIVKISNQNFKIIGVVKNKGGGGLAGGGLDNHVYVPYKAAYSFNPSKKFYAIYLKTKDQETVAKTKEEVEKILAKRYDKDDFSVMEQAEIMETISSIFDTINVVLISIAAISLVVGGIGIMNIMYVSVTERIKEIGIRRTIGAKKTDILYQFLAISVILSVFGGLMGLGLSFIIVFFIQDFLPAYISKEAVVLALGVSSLIGIVFGVFPAKKAADLEPVEAIRYE